MKNYAIENGKKYFMFYDTESDVMKIIDIEETGLKFTSYGEWLCNGKLTHKTLHECIENMCNYTKPIIYKNKNINVWQDDIFITYSNGQFYRKKFFDPSVLESFEEKAV